MKSSRVVGWEWLEVPRGNISRERQRLAGEFQGLIAPSIEPAGRRRSQVGATYSFAPGGLERVFQAESRPVVFK